MKTENFIQKIEEIKEKNKLDLSAGEDLSIALMNIVSLEEHSYFSYIKTNDEKFLEILEFARELRKKLLPLIVKEDGSEKWCMSKHLLASSMRLYEVGCKELSKKNMKEANSYFKSGFELWSLFFAINLKMIEVKKIEKDVLEKEGKKMSKISELMKKIVDCCKEW